MADDVDPTLLHKWLEHTLPQSESRIRQHVAEFGPAILGLAGPLASDGHLGATLGGAPNSGVMLRYIVGDGRIEVATGRRTLGGTWVLLQRILQMSAPPDAQLPFSVAVAERMLMLPVAGGRSQFRVVEATTGHWIAVGGWKNRHLRLEGSPGTSPDVLALTEVVLP